MSKNSTNKTHAIKFDLKQETRKPITAMKQFTRRNRKYILKSSVVSIFSKDSV